MKIRKGFVSNSSTSSFILGVQNTKTETSDDIAIFPCEANNWDIGDHYGPWYYKYRETGYDTAELTIGDRDYCSVTINVTLNDNIKVLYSDTDVEEGERDIYLEDFDEIDVDKYNEILKDGGKVDYWVGHYG